MLHDDYKKSDLNGIKPNQLLHLLSSIHISKGALCTIGFHWRAEKSRVTTGAEVCGSWNERRSQPRHGNLCPAHPPPLNLTRMNWHRGKQPALTHSPEFPQNKHRNEARSVVESALRVQMSSRNREERVLVSKTGKTEPKFRSITLFLHRI